MMQNLSDEELMMEYQRGEAAAMDELLARYKNPVYHFALRLLSYDTSEAEDIAAEVFLKLHQHRASYKPIAKFCTWIFSITHNICVSRLRKKKWLTFWPRKQDDPEELVEFRSPGPTPEDNAASNEVSSLVQKHVQGLPFLQKEALILCEYENLKYDEIARILKKSQGAVKTLIHRARLNLKNKLLSLKEERLK